jgi:hypothetical protein
VSLPLTLSRNGRFPARCSSHASYGPPSGYPETSDLGLRTTLDLAHTSEAEIARRYCLGIVSFSTDIAWGSSHS